jgi:hypothetical protein
MWVEIVPKVSSGAPSQPWQLPAPEGQSLGEVKFLAKYMEHWTVLLVAERERREDTGSSVDLLIAAQWRLSTGAAQNFMVAPSWIKKMDRDLARAGDEPADRYPIQLSGGQQQRVAMAWAM